MMWRIGGIARHVGFKVRFSVMEVRVGVPHALLNCVNAGMVYRLVLGTSAFLDCGFESHLTHLLTQNKGSVAQLDRATAF